MLKQKYTINKGVLVKILGYIVDEYLAAKYTESIT